MITININLLQFPSFIHTQKRNPRTHLKVKLCPYVVHGEVIEQGTSKLGLYDVKMDSFSHTRNIVRPENVLYFHLLVEFDKSKVGWLSG